MEKRFVILVLFVLTATMLANNVNRSPLSAKIGGMGIINENHCTQNSDCCLNEDCGNLCIGLMECISNHCIETFISCEPDYICIENECICEGKCLEGENEDVEGDSEQMIVDDSDYPNNQSNDYPEQANLELNQNFYQQEGNKINNTQKEYIPPKPPKFIGGNCKDKDKDKYPLKFFSCYTGPFDCNDNDPKAYPGAIEICDGMDTDCDGKSEDDNEGNGCIPDFTTAHLPKIKDNKWFRFLQILKDFFKNPPPPLIDEVIFNRNTGELIIYGENFYNKEMKKGITSSLIIGKLENNIYRNAYNYIPMYIEEDYIIIFFQDLPEDIYIWVQIINVIDKRKVHTPGNIYKLKI